MASSTKTFSMADIESSLSRIATALEKIAESADAVAGYQALRGGRL